MHAERIAEEMGSVGFAPELEIVDRRRFGEQVWFGGEYEMFVGPMAPVAVAERIYAGGVEQRGGVEYDRA